MEDKDTRLKIDNLTISYKKGYMAVSDVSFSIKKGETVALVGESGCGKSSIAKAIFGIVTLKNGSITYKNEKKFDRRNVQMIFQDPYSSLNPRMTIEEVIKEPLIVYKIGTKQEKKDRVEELLNNVSLPLHYKHRYPHELSGGERQRVSIARALASKPELLICDEPTHALDVSVQASIINLLKDLRDQYQLSILFISHDLCLVKNIADRCLVMYGGKIIESGYVDKIFSNPLHPYTKKLLAAIPIFEKNAPLYINTEPKREEYKEPLYLESSILHTYVENLQKSIDSSMKITHSNGMVHCKCPYLKKCKERALICETKVIKKVNISSDYYVLCHFAKKNKTTEKVLSNRL